MREIKRALRVAALLTLLSVIAATSGTLAWFQTRRTASISFSEATVRADDANLEITFKHSFNTMTNEKVSPTMMKLHTETKVTDVSGDGVELYEPIWSGTRNTIENGGDGKSEYKVSQINTITPRLPGTQSPSDPGLKADGRFIDFTLSIGRSGGSTSGLNVFLGEDTRLFHISGDTSEVNVLSALRMAVINYSDNSFDTGTPELLFLHAPETEVDATYLKLGAGGAYGSVGHVFADNVDLITAPFVTEMTFAAASADYPPIADLTLASGNESVDVTFRIWIEGTDKDAIAPIIHQEFGIYLDIYAMG